MALDLAKTNGNGRKSLAELLDKLPVQPLPDLSPGSIAPLEEFLRQLRDGSGEEQDSAYKALRHFVGLYDNKFNVPGMPQYKEALQACESKYAMAH